VGWNVSGIQTQIWLWLVWIWQVDGLAAAEQMRSLPTHLFWVLVWRCEGEKEDIRWTRRANAAAPAPSRSTCARTPSVLKTKVQLPCNQMLSSKQQ
jgi:hypothetical protein